MVVNNMLRAVWIVTGAWLIFVGLDRLPTTANPTHARGVLVIGIAFMVAALVPWSKAED